MSESTATAILEAARQRKLQATTDAQLKRMEAVPTDVTEVRQQMENGTVNDSKLRDIRDLWEREARSLKEIRHSGEYVDERIGGERVVVKTIVKLTASRSSLDAGVVSFVASGVSNGTIAFEGLLYGATTSFGSVTTAEISDEVIVSKFAEMLTTYADSLV